MPRATELTTGAIASAAAAAVVAVKLASEPFDHGRWLVAYLLLVGCSAQLLLGRGQAALLHAGGFDGPSREVRLAQTILWNLGVVAVPVGVLAETRLAVVIGSVCLIVALAWIWNTARDALCSSLALRSSLGIGYAALLLGMVASVVVGTCLAWDLPWT